MMKIPAPESWSRYQPEMCSVCLAVCCHLPPEASAADLIRLGLMTEEDFGSDLKATVKRLKEAGRISRFSAGNGVFYLARNENGACIFLKNSRCSVYEKRPQNCRDFPERTGARPGCCPFLPQSDS